MALFLFIFLSLYNLWAKTQFQEKDKILKMMPNEYNKQIFDQRNVHDIARIMYILKLYFYLVL